jgi:hypothetical protein
MDEICPICHESIKYKSITLCGHIFCTPCLLRWGCKNDSCPLCREDLLTNEYENNDTDSVISKEEDEEILWGNIRAITIYRGILLIHLLSALVDAYFKIIALF